MDVTNLSERPQSKNPLDLHFSIQMTQEEVNNSTCVPKLSSMEYEVDQRAGSTAVYPRDTSIAPWKRHFREE
jgi:hypothetical protein